MKRIALSGPLAAVLFLAVSAQVAFSQAQASTPSPAAPVRDPQALALLQASVVAMGKTPPNDTVATGSVTLVAGSSTEEGSIRILTRGTNQTEVQVQTSSGSNWSKIYSNGQANDVEGTQNTSLSMEQASTTQSAYFPLPIISGILTNQDACYQYIGPDTVNERSAQHVQVWNSFNSTPSLRFLASFTITDIWLDAASELPVQISFIRRSGGGAAPKIPISISYSNYQNSGGVLYPYQIEESVNGTLWATVTIQSVVLNTGLSDANFAVTAGGN